MQQGDIYPHIHIPTRPLLHSPTLSAARQRSPTIGPPSSPSSAIHISLSLSLSLSLTTSHHILLPVSRYRSPNSMYVPRGMPVVRRYVCVPCRPVRMKTYSLSWPSLSNDPPPLFCFCVDESLRERWRDVEEDVGREMER